MPAKKKAAAPPSVTHVHTTPDGTRVGSDGNAVYVSTDHGDTWKLVHGDDSAEGKED